MLFVHSLTIFIQFPVKFSILLNLLTVSFSLLLILSWRILAATLKAHRFGVGGTLGGVIRSDGDLGGERVWGGSSLLIFWELRGVLWYPLIINDWSLLDLILMVAVTILLLFNNSKSYLLNYFQQLIQYSLIIISLWFRFLSHFQQWSILHHLNFTRLNFHLEPEETFVFSFVFSFP